MSAPRERRRTPHPTRPPDPHETPERDREVTEAEKTLETTRPPSPAEVPDRDAAEAAAAAEVRPEDYSPDDKPATTGAPPPAAPGVEEP